MRLSARPFYSLFNITRPPTQLSDSFRSCSRTVRLFSSCFRNFLLTILFQFPIADEPYNSHFSSVLSFFLCSLLWLTHCTILINSTLTLTSLLLGVDTSRNMHQHRCFCAILVPQHGGISCCLLSFVIDLY